MLILLDASVLIALDDAGHAHEAAALRFLVLLALEVKHGGCFATFDAGIDARIVPGGLGALRILPVR